MNTNVNYSKGYKFDKELNYITGEELLNEVRLKLSNYFERGVLDDSMFYPVIRECLAKLGSRVYPTSTAILPVEDYKAKLPEDFRKLIVALGCGNFTITDTDPLGKIYDVTPEQVVNYVAKPPAPCIDECGDAFHIVQMFDTYTINFSEYFNLQVSNNSKGSCLTDCFNNKIKSKYQIELDMRSKKIVTNFPTGHIYIEYTQTLEKDGDLLIPDFAQVREWIKKACVTEAFENMFYNLPTAEVQTKLNYARGEESVAEISARSFVKAHEFGEMYDTRRLLTGRYKKFSEMIYTGSYGI